MSAAAATSGSSHAPLGAGETQERPCSCALHTHRSLLQVFTRPRTRGHASPIPGRTQTGRTKFTSRDFTKKVQFCKPWKELSEAKGTAAPAKCHLKGSPAWFSREKAIMPTERTLRWTKRGLPLHLPTQVESFLRQRGLQR